MDDSEDAIIVVAVLLLNLSIGKEGEKDDDPITRAPKTNNLIIFMMKKLSNVAKPARLLLLKQQIRSATNEYEIRGNLKYQIELKKINHHEEK